MILALLLAAATVEAPPPAMPAAPPAAAAAPADKADVQCHMEAVVGTRMLKRICISKAAAAERGYAQRRQLEEVQRGRYQCSSGGGGPRC